MIFFLPERLKKFVIENQQYSIKNIEKVLLENFDEKKILAKVLFEVRVKEIEIQMVFKEDLKINLLDYFKDSKYIWTFLLSNGKHIYIDQSKKIAIWV